MHIRGRFAVYFFTLCSRTLNRRFTGTVAVASSIFCCYSPPSAEANAVVRGLHRRVNSNCFVVPSVDGATRFANLRRKFSPPPAVHMHVCCVGRSLSQHYSSLFTITSYTITVLSLHPSYPATVHRLTRPTLPCRVTIYESSDVTFNLYAYWTGLSRSLRCTLHHSS